MNKVLYLGLALMSLLVLYSCSSDDSSSGPMPVADFTFTNDGSTFTFTNLSENGTEYRWDFGDLDFYSYDESPVHTYNIGGSLKVSLTVTNESGQEAYVVKTIEAPEIIIVNIEVDGDFEDWQDVDYAYESPSSTGSMQKIKIWTGGANVNVYLEGNDMMNMQLVDMFINSDGDTSTGFLHGEWPDGSGADWLFEGPLVSNGWGSFYDHIDPNGSWGWAALAGSGANIKVSSIVQVETGVKAVEFSIPKAVLGELGDTIGFAFTELTEGWALVANFPDSTAFVTVDL
ncbi:MAG: hypothetical protein CL868_16635 [Cytophagaceae bacterium]|nr:hypothetical protein [Cytophagaceae bacterium]